MPPATGSPLPRLVPRDDAPRARDPGRRIREIEAMVADVVVETPDTVTLVLFTGGEPLEYRPGQFVTIAAHQFQPLAQLVAWLEDAKGKREPPRAYSLASEPGERDLAITVKEERYVSGETRYPPLLSPFLVRGLARGTRMVITGFTGPYILPPDPESRADHLVHLVAGSGVVPNWSILKHAVREHPRLRHTVVYSSRTWGDVIYREALARLEAEHGDRVRVVHLLTREGEPERHGPGVRRGRISAALLRELVPDPRACLVYACGPALGPRERETARARGEAPAPRFLEAALAAAQEIGVPADRVQRESWG